MISRESRGMIHLETQLYCNIISVEGTVLIFW